MDEPETVDELKRLLRESEQRNKEIERGRQEEKQRADKERKRADKEARGRREEKQRAEEAERGRQEEKQRANKEQKRAEKEARGRRGEKRRANKEQKRAEKAEEQTRLMTLGEYLTACHELLFSQFSIQTDPMLTSKGCITNPRDKWCPTNLLPWPGFFDQQRTTFGTLYNSFPTDLRAFPCRTAMDGLRESISGWLIGDEKALEYFMHFAVENPVRVIIQKLKPVEEVRRAFGIGDGVIFENHPHALNDGADEIVDRETQDPATPVQTPDHRRDLNKLRPDQICVYRSDNTPTSKRSMVYVCEYKPPHKLTAKHLRLGLRSMDIYEKVMNRPTIPTSADPDAQDRYHAEKLTASAITQTYHYMIESGLEYGLLTTGEAIVFLKIDWDEPETLYYHLSEPNSNVSAHPNDIDIYSAVGQYLAFTLMAIGSQGNGQRERQRAMANLRTWTEDFETVLRSVSESERSALSDSSPGYEPTTRKGVNRGSQPPPKKKHRPAKSHIDEGPPSRREDRREPSDDESAPKPPDTPTPAGRRTGQGARRSQRLEQKHHQGGGSGQGQQYCTQKCLLGMARGDLVDPKCPNVALHCKSRDPARARHPVNNEEWLRLLWEQLEDSLDEGVTPLGQGGARGVLFQVTLLAHGYTFVGKGTVRAFIKDLEHEAAVYERLKPIQGVHVPVFLGAIDLRSMNKTYYYDHRVYVVHMTFLSWGGCRIDTADNMNRPLKDEATRSLKAIHQQGVIHKDVRLPNMLFNSEINGVMVIDFERALLLEPPRGRLAQLVPCKRARGSEGMDVKKVTGGSSKRHRAHGGFSEDIRLAKTAFLEWNARRGK